MNTDQKVLRSHPLTEEELKALDLHTPTVSTGGWRAQKPPETLLSIIEPLYQAVDQLHYVTTEGRRNINTDLLCRSYKRTFTSCVLREMVACRTGYWEWSSEQWRNVALGVKPGSRLGVMAAIYVLCGVKTYYNHPTHISRPKLYQLIFGEQAWHEEVEPVRLVLSQWHFACKSECESGFGHFANTMAYTLLEVGGRTKDITFETLVDIHRQKDSRSYLIAISQALKHLGIINECLSRNLKRGQLESTTAGISSEWLDAFESWKETSTSSERYKNSVEWAVQKVGRWLNVHYPHVKTPEDWTPRINTAFLAAVHRMKVGDYVSEVTSLTQPKIDRSLSARSKAVLIDRIRSFFVGLQRKKLVAELKIDPEVDLETPKSIKNLFGPDPRDIEEETWLRIVWASLNLTEEDCQPYLFPPELIRALAVVWTHCGLRSDEIIRLPVGCVGPIRRAKRAERQRLGLPDLETLVCNLTVPAHKTGPSFSKTVPKVVEKAVRAWEAVRGENPTDLDEKTGKDVHFLFIHRRMRISKDFLNSVLIPLLCRKAGVENYDHRGRFTSHRGRASIVTALYNSDEGMSLDELRRWLGHKSIESTLNYVRHYDRALAEKFARASAPSQLDSILTDAEKKQLNLELGITGVNRVELESGGYCLNLLYEKCANKNACAGCMFHDKETPADKIAKVRSVLLDLSKSGELSEADREAVAHGLALLESGGLN